MTTTKGGHPKTLKLRFAKPSRGSTKGSQSLLLQSVHPGSDPAISVLYLYICMYLSIYIYNIYAYMSTSISISTSRSVALYLHVHLYLYIYLISISTSNSYIYFFLYLDLCLSVSLSLAVSIHLCIYPSIHRSIYLSIYLSIDIHNLVYSIYLSFYLSIYLSFFLSFYFSIYLSIYLSGRRMVGGTGEKGRAQQHEPQHVKGLRCWLIRCMLSKHRVFIAHLNSCPKSSSAGIVEACLPSRFRYVPRSHPPKTLKNTVLFTFSARLAQPRGQHPPHYRHHLHQCPPWMRMMQAMPGMLSTMGTHQKTLVFDSAGSPSKNDPFSPKTRPNILSPLAARSQRKSIAHGRRMVGGGRRHRAAGPVPEGRPSGPRPSAVSRTTGSGAPGGRIYTLTRHSRPPGTLPCSFCHFPFL